MTAVQLFVIVVLIIPLFFVAINKLRVDTAALIIAAALGVGQFLGLGVLGAPNTPGDTSKAIAGLSQPVVMTLFSLFMITRCLDKTGVTRWIARRVLAIGGSSESRLIALFAGATAALSLFMNNLAAGALLLPSAMDVSRRTGIRPSKLLIPVAYGSLLGGVATYFTTANIISSDLLASANPPQAPLHVLDFTPVGGLIAVAGILYLALIGKRLLPDRAPTLEQAAARKTGSELEDAYALGERLWEARIMPGSALVGQTIEQTDIGERLGLSVIALWHGRQAIFAPAPEQHLHEKDILLVVGREDRVNQLTGQGVKIGRENGARHVSERGVHFVEVVPRPHSGAEGKTLRDLNFRKKHGFTAVALFRDGRSFRTDVANFTIQPGDSFLMIGAPERIPVIQASSDFIALDVDPSDKPVQWRQAGLMIAITGGAILASVFGAPVFLSMLCAALLTVLLRLMTFDEAYRTMEWRAIFLIAGMYSVSTAMVKTGLAGLIGDQVVALVTPLGPLGLAAGAYILSSALTQVMGGQVTALVAAPITISAAITLHTSPQAVAIATAIGCSASFFTPIAHPVNILMIGPGNYRFGDFFKVGWPLTILSFVMLLIGLKLFWHL